MNDVPQALDLFLKANELLSDEHYQLKAVINSQAGYIFSHQKLYRPAIEAFKAAYRCDSMAGDTVGMVFILKDLGINYENVNRRDTSILYFEKAMQIAEASGNERMVLIMKTQLAGLYSRTGKYDDAEVFIRDAIRYKNPDNLAAVYSIAAGLFEKTNRIDSAKHYYHLLALTNSVYAKECGYRGLADIAIIQHDLTSAHKYIDLYRTFSDSLIKITATTAVAEMNAQYNYQLREKENVRLREANERKRHVIQLIGLSCAAVVLLLLVALLYINYKSLTIKIRLERRQRVKAVVELAARRKTELSLPDKPKPEEVAILKDIRKILNDYTDVNKYLSVDKWDTLAAYIETVHPLFKERIAEVTKLKEFKYHVCLLVKAGFPSLTLLCLPNTAKKQSLLLVDVWQKMRLAKIVNLTNGTIMSVLCDSKNAWCGLEI